MQRQVLCRMPRRSNHLPIPAHLRPDEDYRLWIDGSYKDGFIGYGIVIMPGNRRHYGGREGISAAEAEALAAQYALASVPEGRTCVVYSDFLPLVRHLNTLADDGRRVRAQYMNDNDPRHREAHELANKGRSEAERAYRKQQRRRK